MFQVESTIITLSEKVETLTTPEAPKDVEPVIVAPKYVIEESLEETIVDAPPLVEEPQPLIFEVPSWEKIQSSGWGA